MQQWTYLGALLVSIAGLAVLDRRHRLAFFYAPRRAALTVGTAMAVFLVWDLLGIGLGIFFSGGSAYALPYMIAPELPIEECFFLFLLCYVTLLIYRGVCSGYGHLRRS